MASTATAARPCRHWRRWIVSGRVIYVGTFGKVAFPALRLGYLVLPKGLIEPFAQRRSLDMRHSEVSTQAVMAEFMAAGHFQRHIRRMRRAALEPAQYVAGALATGFVGGSANCRPSCAGLHVTVRSAALNVSRPCWRRPVRWT
jgi:GntR family transcriptional regulator / MocR family aminotransferase